MRHYPLRTGDILKRLLAVAVVLATTLTGGFWAVLCESDDHVAVEDVFRNCCHHLQDENDPCKASPPGQIVIAHLHTVCVDIPLASVWDLSRHSGADLQRAVASPGAVLTLPDTDPQHTGLQSPTGSSDSPPENPFESVILRI